jgi:DNA-binding SARP family transcriptional activator
MPLIFNFLLSLSFAIMVYAQSNHGGVKFNTTNVERHLRTSLFINNGNPIKFDSSFSLSFDISFWNQTHFGPILRIEDKNGEIIRIVYSPHKDRETAFFDIITPDQQNRISIPVSKREISRNRWFNLKLKFDRDYNKATFSINGNPGGTTQFNFNHEQELKFTFGIKDLATWHDFDVPGMYIRDISISVAGKMRFFWSLNPFEDYLTDTISGSKLKLLNPGWLFEDHKRWRKIANIKIADQLDAYLGIAYDSAETKFYIDRSDALVIYDLITGRDSVILYETKSPAIWNESFYDRRNNLLYSYMNGGSKVSIFDLNTSKWIRSDTLVKNSGNNFGSGKFSYPEEKDLYLLGGYGWYKFKKDLLKYNFNKEEWIRVNLRRNEMSPRSWFAFGSGLNKGEYLIYGGMGNESGLQEDGTNLYYDLYLLDLINSTITKLNMPAEDTFPYAFLFNDLYLDKSDSVFYFLTQNDMKTSFPVSLKSFSLKNGKIESYGNEFWERSDGKWIYAHLHYSERTNELLSVIYDTTYVEIYAINLPLIPEGIEIFPVKEITESSSSYYLWFLFIVLIIAAAYHYKKRRNKKPFETPIVISPIRNYIRLFGGFQVIDRDGKDITLCFSPKLKELFLLILHKSIIRNHRRGITSEELSSILWPDSSPENIKSNRGVAINKIRKILSLVEGIELEFADKLWVINTSNGGKIDYIEFTLFREKLRNINGAIPDEVAAILEAGEFLKGISYEWLEASKVSINNEIIKLLKNSLTSQAFEHNEEKLIRICDLILNFDPVESETIKIKIKILYQTNRQSLAKNTYNLFMNEYRNLYDESYPGSFNDIISS